MNSLLQKSVDGVRLSPAEALDILKNAPWTEVAQAANTVRHRINPGNKVGYTTFRIINYTNVCEITCSFCSFCRPAHSPEAYVLNLDEIRQKTLEAKAKGADQIFFARWREQGHSAQLLHRRAENAHAGTRRKSPRIFAGGTDAHRRIQWHFSRQIAGHS